MEKKRFSIEGTTCKNWIFVLLLIPFFRPMGVEMAIIPRAYDFFVMWLYLSIGLFGLLFFTKTHTIRLSDMGIKVYILYTLGISAFSDIIVGNNVPMLSLITFCGAALLVLFLAQWDYRALVNSLFIYFLLLNVLNALFILLPIGKTYFTGESIFFVGHRQSLPMLWAIALFVWGIRTGFQECDKRKATIVLNIAYLLLCTFNLLASGSATAILVAAIYLLMYIFLVVKGKVSNLKYSIFYYVFIIGVIVNLLLVYGNIQYHFGDMIMKYFGETVTLNGRTVIWKYFKEYYYVNPFWGWGYNALRINVGWGKSWANLDYCHNSILQELINGGLCGTLVFGYMVLSSLRKVGFCDNERVKKIALCTLVSFMVIMCSESVNYYNYFLLFLILLSNMWRVDQAQKVMCEVE